MLVGFLTIVVVLLAVGLWGTRGDLAKLRRDVVVLRQSIEALLAEGVSREKDESSDEADVEVGDVAGSDDRGAVDTLGNEDEPVSDVAAAAAREGLNEAATGVSSSFVFNAEVMGRAVAWCKVNWFYLIAALSLALSGIFLIQYGVERGLLSPPIRVLTAVALGVMLLTMAEWLRRRGGDEEGDALAYLPSTLAAGGVVTLFATTWGAYGLYALIGPGIALVLLAALGLATIGLGWFYGPLLSAIGIAGATVAPFLTGGDNSAAYTLNYYFAVIVVAGLAIDALKRWAWLSTLALIMGFAAATLVYIDTHSMLHFMIFAAISAIAASAIPNWSPVPTHEGNTVLGALFSRFRSEDKVQSPTFPTRLSWGAVAVTSAIFAFAHNAPIGGFWLALVGFAGLFVLTIIWMRHAPALADVVLWPALGLLAVGVLASPKLIFVYWISTVINRDQLVFIEAERSIYAFVGLAVLAGVAAGWRSLFTLEKYRTYWTLFAVSFAPVAAVVVEVFWMPSEFLGASIWGLCLIGIAAIMMVFVQRYSAVDEGDKTRLSYALVSAMTMTAFALMIVLGPVGLTLALAVMIVVSVALDRRFDLPLLARLASIGVVLVSGRLVVHPGVLWAVDAALWPVILAFCSTIVLLILSLLQLRGENRAQTRGVIESAVWSLSAIFVSLMLLRWLGGRNADLSHWSVGLFAFIWLSSSVVQYYRVELGGGLVKLRQVLGGFYGIVGCFLLLIPVFNINPLFDRGELVVGPQVFNSLLIAYGLPALVFGFAAYKFDQMKTKKKTCLISTSILLLVVYVGLAIRHVWRGPSIVLPGMSDGELYSYTVAMMIVSSTLLFLALYRQSGLLRRIALAALGISAAKVFLIDAAGLAGLFRVVSFLALGLALAGLAWLDRRFGGTPDGDQPETTSKDGQRSPTE